MFLKGRSSYYQSEKIIKLDKIKSVISSVKAKKLVIGLCHGGYDLLHPGHIRHFQSAKSLCDVLIVSVTSDRFVTERKGHGRPIFSDRIRAYMIASLEVVDYVTISDFKRGTEVIKFIRPDIYIKGPDFAAKTTPGITAERDVIKAIGGRISYTRDPKLATTEIIKYIQSIQTKPVLVVCDRDGTLITENDYLGRAPDWMKHLSLNREVVGLLSYLNTAYEITLIAVSNQSGVARGHFPESRVRRINALVNKMLADQNVKVSSWQYSPNVDLDYAKSQSNQKFKKKYVKSKSGRKPDPDMVIAALKSLDKRLNDYAKIVVVGDRPEDELLARNIGGYFIDVRNRKSQYLINSVRKYLTA